MYTAQEIFNNAIAIIDEISDNGTINATQVKEYSNRAPYFLDMWQKKMAKTGDLYKTFEKSCFRKNNLLGEFESFNIIEHTTKEQPYEAYGANCFHFGVDSQATVRIEEEINGVWTACNGVYMTETEPSTAFTGTIQANTSTDSFNHYKGILSPANPDNKIRLVFGGNYYYKHINRALCPYKYPSIDRVPDFKPYYKLKMPSDFKVVSTIIDEYPSWQYEEGTHKWEGKDLYVHFGYEGIIRIKYIPIPAKITSLSQTLEVDDITAQSGAYYLAEHFALADQNTDLAKKCKEEFRALQLESTIKAPLTATIIKDVYGLGGGNT